MNYLIVYKSNHNIKNNTVLKKSFQHIFVNLSNKNCDFYI